MLTWGSGTQGQLGRVGERVSVRQRTATFLEPQAIKLPRGSGKAVDIAAGYYATFIITDNDKVKPSPCFAYLPPRINTTLTNPKIIRFTVHNMTPFASQLVEFKTPTRLALKSHPLTTTN